MFFKRKKTLEQKLIEHIKPLLERIMQYVNNDIKNVDKIYAYCSNEYDNVYFHPYFVINNCYSKIHRVNNCSDEKYDVSDDAQLTLLREGKNLCKKIFNIFKDYKQEIPTQIIISYDVKKEKLHFKLDYDLHWSNTDDLLAEDIGDKWFEELKKSDDCTSNQK